MANVFATIQKYLTKAIDTVFVTESKSNILVSNNKFVDVNFDQAGYVKIASMLLDGLSDYYRVNDGTTGVDHAHYQRGEADGYKVGNASLKWELFKLRYDRGKQFQIDNADNEETAGLLIGNLLTEFARTMVVPEVDAVRFSAIAEKCSTSLGNLVSEDIGADEIIGKFNTAFEWLSEHEVPAEDQVIFVSPKVITLIRNTTEIVKYLGQADYRYGDVTFKLETYSGRPLIEVPSNRFFTNVLTTQNGFIYQSTSHPINFMVVSRRATIPIVKINKSKIWTPDTVQDFDGYKVNLRIYHDLIIPKNKVLGAYTSVATGNANSATRLLDVLLSEGSVTNAFKLDEFYTTPAGLNGKVIYNTTTAFTVGQTAAVSGTNKLCVIGADNVEASAANAYFALTDGEDKVLAVSKQITLPKKS